MKKVYKIIIALVCALILCCIAVAGNRLYHSISPKPDDEDIMQTKPVTTENTEHACYEQIHFYDLDEYTKFTSTADLPENFVTAESLAPFGEFYGWVCLSDGINGDYSRYMYDITIENWGRIPIYVRHNQPIRDNETAIDISKVTSTMQNLSVKNSGTITRDGFTYTYRNGELKNIRWRTDNIEFTISIEYTLPDCSTLPQNHLLYRMMSSSEVVFASVSNEVVAIVSGQSDEGSISYDETD